MGEAHDAALVRLKAISEILGVPVDRFMIESVPRDLSTADECLKLWSCLRTSGGRQRALDALRRVVDEEAA